MIRLSELKLPLSALPVIEQAPADEHGDSRNASQAPERVHPLTALRELAALACALGLLLGHGLAHALGWALQAQGLLPVTGAVWLSEEAGVPLLAGLVAALAALLPAMQAYRTDVADLLVQP